jgi:hypothetical protein
MRRTIAIAFLCFAAMPARADSGWLTDPQTHCRVWDSDVQPEVSIRWKGTCRAELAEGAGVLEWSNGKLSQTVEGNWRAGRMEGRAFSVFSNGTRVETEFRDGLIDGLCVVTLADGTKIQSHYRADKPFGRVQVAWPNGEKLDGEVDENQQVHGVRSSPDGSKYEGDLKNYVPDGKGSLIRADGLRYKGDFVAGKIEGEGEMLFSDGGLYQGTFRDGKPNGHGTMRAANGQIYRGFWVDGCLSQPNADNGMWAASGRSGASCGFD